MSHILSSSLDLTHFYYLTATGPPSAMCSNLSGHRSITMGEAAFKIDFSSFYSPFKKENKKLGTKFQVGWQFRHLNLFLFSSNEGRLLSSLFNYGTWGHPSALLSTLQIFCTHEFLSSLHFWSLILHSSFLDCYKIIVKVLLK